MEDSIYYDSWKEERDVLLEYNQVTLGDVNIVNILGVGIDNVNRAQAVVKVMKMIEGGGVHHVISLNPYKLHRIKSNQDLRLISSKAAMHFASGAGLQWSAKMLRAGLKERIPLMSFLMDLVRIAEIKEYSIFIVGGRPEIAEKTFFNIRKSFPNIRIVGRHGGYFNPERELSVVEAIRKSQADIILVGMGFPLEDKWIYKYKNEFRKAVLISVGGSIDYISGEVKLAPPFFMGRGLDWFYRIVARPWRIGRLFRSIFFFIQVIFSRLFSR
ncbi:MAG: glycosyltransferase [Spirochaetes bacterium]|nr:MAG: glycosyltransferase [Spirochaetota bacterium]